MANLIIAPAAKPELDVEGATSDVRHPEPGNGSRFTEALDAVSAHRDSEDAANDHPDGSSAAARALQMVSALPGPLETAVRVEQGAAEETQGGPEQSVVAAGVSRVSARTAEQVQSASTVALKPGPLEGASANTQGPYAAKVPTDAAETMRLTPSALAGGVGQVEDSALGIRLEGAGAPGPAGDGRVQHGDEQLSVGSRLDSESAVLKTTGRPSNGRSLPAAGKQLEAGRVLQVDPRGPGELGTAPAGSALELVSSYPEGIDSGTALWRLARPAGSVAEAVLAEQPADGNPAKLAESRARLARGFGPDESSAAIARRGAVSDMMPAQSKPESLRAEWRMDQAVQAAGVHMMERTTVEAAIPNAGLGTRSGGKDLRGNADETIAAFGLRDVSQVGATPEKAQAFVGPSTDARVEQHVRIIDQVVRDVKLYRLEGRSDILVRLNPPELGALRVHITQDAGGMHSYIHASSEHVRGLLQAHLPVLTDALAEAGLKMDSVSISSSLSSDEFANGAAQSDAYGQSGRARQRGASVTDVQGMHATDATIPLRAYADHAGYSWLA